MLAPRKRLWKTPSEVVAAAAERVPLQSTGDTVVDLGCGDGSVLVQWARDYANRYANTRHATCTFIGIDIEESRISEAKSKWKMACLESPNLARIVKMEFHCGNALDVQDLWQFHATVLFLYLIPRGLRRIYPLIGQSSSIRAIASFMNPLVDMNSGKYSQERLRIAASDETLWPLYIYEWKEVDTQGSEAS